MGVPGRGGGENFFQSLEKRRKIFPIVGKNGRNFPSIGKKFSNHPELPIGRPYE
jgi:hypothetical protein